MSEIIKSIRETIGVEYEKPDTKKIDGFIIALHTNREAKDYLRNRGFEEETIAYFRLGYDEGKKAISIPIYKNGELVNIKYRILNPTDNKYTSERGAETWVYHEDGFDIGEKKGGVLIVEGEFDCMMAWQNGFTNVVSPASGKDSFGVWLERLDNIPKVYIAYDNDTGGKESAYKMAERIGVAKSREVLYPEGIKDANEFFLQHSVEEFKDLIKEAKQYYRYQFQGLGDVITSLRKPKDSIIKTQFFPQVKMEKDWLVIVSGKTNSGKTSYVLNVADDLVGQDVPTLVMPFERGIETMGKRFMSITYDKTLEEFGELDDGEWGDVIEECVDKPLYFAVPKKDEIIETIIKSKRLFDTKVVIVDHLDYLIRHVSGSREAEIANTLQNLKSVAEEHGIVIIIVTHIRKIEQAGATIERKPNLDDLKGSSSLSQDPECVILVNQEENGLEVNVAKNKGEMTSQLFAFKPETGRISKHDLVSTFEDYEQ